MGNTEFILKAKYLVKKYAIAHIDVMDKVNPDDVEVYVVWNAFILGNIKALISTTLRDGMYYEVTYNSTKDEIYFDAYKKFENQKITNIEEEIMPDIKQDEHGLNLKIQSHILSEEKMRQIGFTDYYKSNWFYCKNVDFPNNKRYRNWEVSFNIIIPKNGDRLLIDVLDENFLQPYDYQEILKTNPNFEPCLIVNEFVEKQMEYLQSQGVLSGHEYGEYI